MAKADSVNWRLGDLLWCLFFTGAASASALNGVWWLVVLNICWFQLQLVETVLHALGDAIAKEREQ